MKNAITKKQRKLLLYSYVTEQHPKLKHILENCEVILENSPALKNEGYEQQLIAKIIETAGMEWHARPGYCIEELEGDERKPCSLCGTPNKIICYIKNDLTGKEINVGRECLKEFRSDLGPLGSKSTAELHRLAQESTRNKNLSEKFPNILALLSSLSDYLEQLEIVVSPRLRKKYLEEAEKLKSIVDKYIENGDLVYLTENEALIQSMLNEVVEIKKSIQEYIESHRDDFLIPNRKIINWLKRNNCKTAIDWIFEEGKITERTAHRVGEEAFLRSLVPAINTSLKKVSLMISEVSESMYTLRTETGVRIRIPSSWLIMEFWDNIYNEKAVCTNVIKDISRNATLHPDDYLLFSNYLDTSFDWVYDYDSDTNTLIIKAPEGEGELVELTMNDLLFCALDKKISQTQVKDQLHAACKYKSRFTVEQYKELLSLRRKPKHQDYKL